MVGGLVVRPLSFLYFCPRIGWFLSKFGLYFIDIFLLRFDEFFFNVFLEFMHHWFIAISRHLVFQCNKISNASVYPWFTILVSSFGVGWYVKVHTEVEITVEDIDLVIDVIYGLYQHIPVSKIETGL